jgi:hypothetical protein
VWIAGSRRHMRKITSIVIDDPVQMLAAILACFESMYRFAGIGEKAA